MARHVMFAGEQPGYFTVASDHADDVWIADGRKVVGPSSITVLFDPKLVLADITAKRKIVEVCAPVLPVRTEAELHAAAAHPDWEYATTEGQRKAWYDEDRPPAGEGWVRNVERGDQGWERFDYTEEAYWRRPRTEPRQPCVPLVLRLFAEPFSDHPDYDEAWRPDSP